MKRNILLTLTLVLVLAMSAFAVACETGPQPDNSADANKVTVTYYDYTTELKSVKIDKGAKAENWTPTKDGYEFLGWYSDIAFVEAFDFDKAIDADVDIFASFKSNAYVEDTTEYYAIGTGAGDMAASGWDHTKSAAALALTKDTTVTNKNVYTITLDLYAGDMFQICYGGSWTGQMGIGNVVGNVDLDKDNAEVKNADGEVVFFGKNENNNASTNWNIQVAEGMDGEYKITLTTYPGQASLNTIEYELIKAIEPLTKTHQMYLVGTLDAENPSTWYDNAEDTAVVLTESQDKAYWTGTITVTAANYPNWDGTQHESAYIKVKNAIGGKDYGENGGSNNIALVAGTYTVRYTVATNMVEVAEAKYYVYGTFVDGEGKAVNYSIKEGVTPVMTVADGVATATITAADVTSLNDYSWIKDQGKDGVFAIKVAYGSELLRIADYGQANGDNYYLAAGNYTISFDIATSAITVTAA